MSLCKKAGSGKAGPVWGRSFPIRHHATEKGQEKGEKGQEKGQPGKRGKGSARTLLWSAELCP